MYAEEVTIENELGMHARPAALFTRTASQFKSEVYICKDGQQINGKSILGVMMLAAHQGTLLLIQADGEDEMDAVAALVGLVRDKFGEH